MLVWRGVGSGGVGRGVAGGGGGVRGRGYSGLLLIALMEAGV